MNAWNKELFTLLWLLIAITILGALTGHFIALLFLLMLFVIIKQITQINRFENWMRSGGRGKLPKTTGIWEEYND
jgi:two-component system phosphate regulon sensor histidine kinase PhoR